MLINIDDLVLIKTHLDELKFCVFCKDEELKFLDDESKGPLLIDEIICTKIEIGEETEEASHLAADILYNQDNSVKMCAYKLFSSLPYIDAADVLQIQKKLNDSCYESIVASRLTFCTFLGDTRYKDIVAGKEEKTFHNTYYH